ncbi:MAG: hypothetical protein JWM80_1718 [Cyanobacteria bacterium RYN_339]|nr:hypothetical protein [Cyanobacteria bacterium RYN_339]
MDENVRRQLGASAADGADDAAVMAGLEADTIAWDDKTRRLISTASDVPIDESIRPFSESPHFGSGVEQCMEFAIRYFREVMQKAGRFEGSFGTDWTTQYNMSDDIRRIASGRVKKDGYTAYLSAGTVPPRAGDVVVFETPKDQQSTAHEFHVAIVSKVFQRGGQWYGRIYEANVPLGSNDPDVSNHFEDVPLTVRNGTFSFARLDTTAKKYKTDMDCVGWLHPLGMKSLPGAVARMENYDGRVIGYA